MQDGEEVFFKIKNTTQLKKLMDAYCQRQNVLIDLSSFPLAMFASSSMENAFIRVRPPRTSAWRTETRLMSWLNRLEVLSPMPKTHRNDRLRHAYHSILFSYHNHHLPKRAIWHQSLCWSFTKPPTTLKIDYFGPGLTLKPAMPPSRLNFLHFHLVGSHHLAPHFRY